jgi:hypothetical protein
MTEDNSFPNHKLAFFPPVINAVTIAPERPLNADRETF